MERRGNISLWLLALIGIGVAAPAGVLAQQTTLREYPYIYKSSRAMGMGGADTAVGGRVDTLFYNPAGLMNIPSDKGWEINFVNVNAELGKRTEKFLRSVDNATRSADLNGDGTTADEKLQAINDTLAQHRGSNMHELVADFSSIGRRFGRFAFGVGAVGSGRIDAVTHEGFGADGFLEVNADVLYGAAGGVSVALGRDLVAGVGIKALHREAVVHQFTARELIEHERDLSRFLTHEHRLRGDGVGADAGLIWKFMKNSALRPSIGLSVLNIGGLDFGNAGTIPMTVNAGFAVNPTVPLFRSFTVAVDYVDLGYNYEQDRDEAKRLRAGVEVQLFDVLPIEATLRAGMYQMAPTLGFDARILLAKVSYALYQEELGAYAGQNRDVRHLLTLSVGW